MRLFPGVIPSLHVGYKSSKIKQHFKEDRALRTEATINNINDFGLPFQIWTRPFKPLRERICYDSINRSFGCFK